MCEGSYILWFIYIIYTSYAKYKSMLTGKKTKLTTVVLPSMPSFCASSLNIISDKRLK